MELITESVIFPVVPSLTSFLLAHNSPVCRRGSVCNCVCVVRGGINVFSIIVEVISTGGVQAAAGMVPPSKWDRDVYTCLALAIIVIRIESNQIINMPVSSKTLCYNEHNTKYTSTVVP